MAWLTATMAAARAAATRMAPRKKATFDDWCHSGWEKKERSWTVTTLGPRAATGIV